MYKSFDRKRKKKKRIIITLVILILLAILSGAAYYLLLTRTVKTVYVEGNVHYSQEEIQEMVMDGFWGHNSIYLSLAYKDKHVSDIPFVAAIDVKVMSPDTVKIVVYEKTLAGYVEYLNRYLYFDKEGVVVEISEIKTQGIPQITGLTFDHVLLNEPLPVENPEVFNQVLSMTKTLKKYELSADRIYFNSQMDMTIYFGNIRVPFGSDKLIDEKIMLLQTLLPQIEGKSGVLNLENYDENTDTISFTPDS